MTRGWRVAVVGAAGLVGHQVVLLLEQRGFPVEELLLIEEPSRLGNLPETGLAARATVPADAALEGCALVFLCAPAAASSWWAARVPAGAVAIDLSGVLAEDPAVPVVVPEVNAAALAAVTDTGRVVSPDPAAVAAAVVAGPLGARLGLAAVRAVCLEPASAGGEHDMNELARQSAELLSGRDPEPAAGTPRVGFNCLAGSGAPLDGERTEVERRIERELPRIVDRPDLAVMATVIRAPAFFGHGVVLDLETTEPADVEEVRRILRGAPGLVVLDDPGRARFPGLVDALDADAVIAGRVRVADSDPTLVRVWAVVEGTRKGGALNAVEMAEILARDYL